MQKSFSWGFQFPLFDFTYNTTNTTNTTRTLNITSTASKPGTSFFSSGGCVGAGDTKAETVATGEGVAATGVGVIAEAAAAVIPGVTVDAGDAVGKSAYVPPKISCFTQSSSNDIYTPPLHFAGLSYNLDFY
ncbi:hypothetical protein C5S35_11320 [Candidatus Methanophagaceae archaeon]|nr:hypothetical protein C5S35_11320 [Methanophagales archaeon]